MCSPDVMAFVRQRLQTQGGLNRRQVLGASGVVVAGAMVLPHMGMAQGATPVVGSTPTSAASGVVDLTHLLAPDTPVWPGNEPFRADVVKSFESDGFYAQSVSFWEHTGTHLDAPAHFVPEGDTAEHLPAENLIAPLVVIDISVRTAGDPDTAVTVDDIAAWESTNGPIPDRAFVAMHSGWAVRIDDPESFVNMDADGVMHYPGFHPEATALLVEQRNIVGIGVDTLSLDPGNSTDFGTHVTALGAGKYGVEGLANLDQVPASGATVFIGAPKHLNASGGPSRVVALVQALL